VAPSCPRSAVSTPEQHRGSRDCERCASRTASASIWVNAGLGVFKFVTGSLARSAGVAVDGVQSLACAAVAGLVVAARRLSGKPATRGYPYGYRKAEFLVAVASFAGLFGLGVFMLVSSIVLLKAGRSAPPHPIAIPVSLISVFSNRMLADACECAGRVTRSAGLTANAGQNRADMVSSCAVALGTALSQIGPSFYFCDSLSAVLAALLILRESAVGWWEHMQVLLDRPLTDAARARVAAIAESVDGVAAARFVETTQMGERTAIDLGIDLPEAATVGDADRIGSEIRQRIMIQLAWVGRVDVYPYPNEPPARPRRARGRRRRELVGARAESP